MKNLVIFSRNNTQWRMLLFVMCMVVGISSNVFATDRDDATTRFFRFVQITDSQPKIDVEDDWQKLSESIDLVNRLKPAFVLMPGDITDRGSEYEYKRIKQLLSKIKAPLHMVPGNHDIMMLADDDELADSKTKKELHERKLALYRKYLGREQWSVEYGDFQFVGLNCCMGWPDLVPESKRWLKNTFSRSNKPYKFIVVHWIIGEGLNWDTSFFESTQTFNTDADRIMSSAGAMGYIQGHNHKIQAYKDANSGRLVFSAGSAVHRSDYGVMYFDVYKDSMVCFWQPVNGDARPLGVFNLKKIAADLSKDRKKVIDTRPYVSQLKSTEITIKWQTNPPLETSLKFRKKADKPWLSKDIEIEPNSHEILIDGLDPNTEYEFYVDADTHEFARLRSEILFFKTPDIEK